MRAIPTAGIPITPKQFISQWKVLPHKLGVNIWNFEVKVGKAAEETFKKSFELKRFNAKGQTTWAPRKRRPKDGHELMVETGSLYHSIKWIHTGTKGEPSGVKVFTDPNGFKKARRNKGRCYAAVHNGPSEFRTKHMTNMPRRQFIGHSGVLKQEMLKLESIIFQGFPK